MSEMGTTQKTLKELSKQIDDLNAAITAREGKLAEQARTVQVNGYTQNYVDFLLESESFSDVLGRADVVSKIVSANQDLVKQQAEDKAKSATVVNTSVTTEKSAVETTSAEKTVATTEQKPEATPTTSLPVSGGSWGSVQGAAFGVQGTPYLYGGVTTSGFDCSGFTQYAFSAAGVSLPRTASAQYSASTKISQSQAKPGDLVFFNQTGSIDHVGIYLGNGSFIGAQSSSGVSVAQINQYYWGKYVVGYGRVN